MNQARSIKQNAQGDALPNFRNLGIVLRILVICNGLALLQALLLADAWADVAQRMLQIWALLTPVLLLVLLLLWLLQPWLDRLPYRQGALAVIALAMALTLSIYEYGRDLFNPGRNPEIMFNEVRILLLCMTVCVILLLYFRLRAKLLSRSLQDARLQVLRARIRPHFLFNTINAVLGIVRSQPGRAETALEDMADLFRMAMADAQDLVPLKREIELCRQYVALEQLRMGDRLSVEWKLHDVPPDALIPPLLLQPLLENAVYHGIEPLPEGGAISIVLQRNGDELQLRMENPCPVSGPRVSSDTAHHGVQEHPRGHKQHRSNRVALQNIRERLDMLFDAEAQYRSDSGEGYYRVEIDLPYVRERLHGGEAA